MKRLVTAILALALAVGSGLTVVPDAKAENGQVAAGVAGGLIGGMLLGGALASRPAPPPTVYYAPQPERVYVEEPACRMVRERFWDGYDWHYRRVEVCN
jgi:hypothetical protein